jgi:hypothetical protein
MKMMLIQWGKKMTLRHCIKKASGSMRVCLTSLGARQALPV